MSSLEIILLVVAVAAIAAAIALYVHASGLKGRLRQHQDAMESQRAAYEIQRAAYEDRLAAYEERLAGRANDLTAFRDIADAVLRQRSAELTQDNGRSLATLLDPLRERIEHFENTVTQAYSSEARERFSLERIIEQLAASNHAVADNARTLSDALHGNNRLQGQWGEMVLESVLERCGLKSGIHFTVQATADSNGSTLCDEDGRRLRPDVVVSLPGDRVLVIDSKVSMTSYLAMCEAKEKTAGEQALAAHVRSVRTHVRELASKKYHEYVGTRRQDFVLMFIPNEGAYLAAMNGAPDLWQEAYDRHVVIVSPTHLYSVMRLVEQLWKQDDIDRNAMEIARESGNMLSKFSDFVNDLRRIGSALDSATRTYQAALGKLSEGRGNLISRAEKIQQLGARSSKPLPTQNSDKE